MIRWLGLCIDEALALLGRWLRVGGWCQTYRTRDEQIADLTGQVDAASKLLTAHRSEVARSHSLVSRAGITMDAQKSSHAEETARLYDEIAMLRQLYAKANTDLQAVGQQLLAVQAELQQARETNAALHRRTQEAESLCAQQARKVDVDARVVQEWYQRRRKYDTLRGAQTRDFYRQQAELARLKHVKEAVERLKTSGYDVQLRVGEPDQAGIRGVALRAKPRTDQPPESTLLELLLSAYARNEFLQTHFRRLRSERDEMVRRNRLLRDRPDLPVERAKAYDAVTAQLDALQKENRQLHDFIGRALIRDLTCSVG